MDAGLILETTFLVDLEREERRREAGPAHRFLRDRQGIRLSITTTTVGEMACGLDADDRDAWRRMMGRFSILPIDLDVCWRYGRAFDYLKRNGLLIGANDLWIAATALANDLPLATRNERHFGRVPGLEVVGYGGGTG